MTVSLKPIKRFAAFVLASVYLARQTIVSALPAANLKISAVVWSMTPSLFVLSALPIWISPPAASWVTVDVELASAVIVHTLSALIAEPGVPARSNSVPSVMFPILMKSSWKP